MKNINFFIYFILGIIMPYYLLSQDSTCGFQESNSIEKSFAGISYFDDNLTCDPLTLKCNFVILRRNDGTGAMSETHSVWTTWENGLNSNLANITDPDDCSSGYPLDSKIRVDFEVHTIDSTVAWDWYAEANADNYPSSSKPYKYICPRFDNDWDALEDVMDDFEANNPGDINIFFIENGELIDLLEDHLDNSTEPSQAYVDRFAEYKINNPSCGGCGGLPSGCSIYPGTYYSTESDNSYVMSGVYANYLIRNNFHDIWWPEYASESASTVWGWFVNETTLTLLHEFGHNLIRTSHHNSCQQVMTTDFFNRSNYITKDHLDRIHSNLATTDLHNAVDCSSITSSTCPMVVESNETIDEPMSVFGDLIIEEGVTLTITSEVYFSEYSSIIVNPTAKLIVNGGTLTSDCGSSWEGIDVFGGNSDFDVKIHNNATVENAEIAVDMFPFGSYPNHGNGILIAEDSDFIDCDMVAYFIAFLPSKNSSSIDNCTIDGSTQAVFNYNCNEINILDCVFTNIDETCLIAANSSFIASGNDFDGDDQDVLLMNVHSGFSHSFTNNNFEGGNYGIQSNGGFFGPMFVFNNDFSNPDINIWYDGHSFYQLEQNDFTGDFGVLTHRAGAESNSVDKNSFSGNVSGLLTTNRNMRLTFNSNCFSTSVFDIYVNGSVASVQGTPELEAGNCFTGQSVTEIGPSSNNFKYYLYEDQTNTCKDIANSSGFSVEDALNDNDDYLDCGSSGFATQTYTYCKPQADTNYVKTAISYFRNKIAETESDTTLTSEVKEAIILSYIYCLRRVSGILFELYLKEEKFESARTVLDTSYTNDDIIKIYSSYLIEGDTASAQNYLDTFPETDDEMEAFAYTQQLYLNRLVNGPTYVPNSTELTNLRMIGIDTFSYSAYARSLYYLFTDVLLSSEIPSIGSEEKKAKELISFEAGEIEQVNLTVSPNPATVRITLSNPDLTSFSCRIIDIAGNLVYSGYIEESESIISTLSWHPGIYFVECYKDNKKIEVKKLLISH